MSVVKEYTNCINANDIANKHSIKRQKGMVVFIVKLHAEIERLKAFERFYCHIEEHLGPKEKVICKICGKSLDEIKQALKG